MPKLNDVCGGTIKSDGNGGGVCSESKCKITYLSCMVGEKCLAGVKKIGIPASFIFCH